MNMFKFTTRGILSGRKYSQLNTFSMPNTKTLRRCHIYKVISKLNLRLQNLLKKKMLPSKSYLGQETQIMNVQYLCKWWSFKMAYKPESWRWQHMGTRPWWRFIKQSGHENFHRLSVVYLFSFLQQMAWYWGLLCGPNSWTSGFFSFNYNTNLIDIRVSGTGNGISRKISYLLSRLNWVC